MDKLKKNSTTKEADVLADSLFFNDSDITDVGVPMMNVALSGTIDGGLTSGLTMLAGPSKHFKTSFALLMAAAYLRKHQDAILLFYDSEFGSPQSYFKQFGIDTNRVLHTPVKNVEDLKFDIISQLEGLDREDNVIILVDSIGNLASNKELEDAKIGKSVADMTRAKSFKGLFRMVTPYLKLKKINLICINHTYKEIGLFPKDIVGGGCVVEGTKIKTPEGLIEIQNIMVGDSVYTSDGIQQVSHIWNPNTLIDGNPECYEIEFDDGYKVTCSAEHKFLIDNEWVKAKDLQVNMDCKISAE